MSRHILKLKIRKNSDTGDNIKIERLVWNVGGMGNTSNALGKTKHTRKDNIKIDLKQDLRMRIKINLPHAADKCLALVNTVKKTLTNKQMLVSLK